MESKEIGEDLGGKGRGGGGLKGEDRSCFAIADSLSKLVTEISEISEYRGPLRSLYGDLARRLKLLVPLFEELKDGVVIGEEEIRGMILLEDAFVSARNFLRGLVSESKIYQAVRYEFFAEKFLTVSEQLEKALSCISYNKLSILVEVQEQVGLIHSQFRRAKGNIELKNDALSNLLSFAYTENITEDDLANLERLSKILEIRTRNDLQAEETAVKEKFKNSNVECGILVAAVLKRIKEQVPMEITNSPPGKSTNPSKLKSPVIPDDFRCPISLELMKDPVIVSTGQTYERASIQKWLNSGHKSCPKTQQPLSHTLTPNYVLKSLIAQWCESNGLDLHKDQGDCHDNKSAKCKSDCDQAGIQQLLQKLKRGNIEERRAAAGHLRLLAKRNADNRVCIADAGVIPLLVQHLSSIDARTQEHSVTALLNLSINETNKGLIVDANAIPEIVEVLKKGSMEARENAAATLFSLSVVDVNKSKIGEAGAMPVLIQLLSDGSPRGKKDAITAIFNLALNQENKMRAVKFGIIDQLMKMLKDPSKGMIDEALAVMALLAGHQEGKLAIGNSNSIPLLVGLVRTGSPRNRENSAAVLSSLCADDEEKVKIAKECGAEEALKELSDCGTDRAKRKAKHLLEILQKNEVVCS